MVTRSFIILCLLLSSFTPRNKHSCAPIDILLLADVSSSIGGNKNQVVNAFKGFIKGFDLDENGVRIGIITFSDDAKVFSPITSDLNKLSIAYDSLNNMSLGSSTKVSSGFYAVEKEFLRNGRWDAMRILILVSDGDPDSYYESTEKKELIQQAKNLNVLHRIMICSILVTGSRVDQVFMREISNGCYAETDYSNLLRELQKLNFCL